MDLHLLKEAPFDLLRDPSDVLGLALAVLGEVTSGCKFASDDASPFSLGQY